MQKGFFSPAVMRAQVRLNLHLGMKPQLRVDGAFDQRTEDAITVFQLARKITVDKAGTLGFVTITELDKEPAMFLVPAAANDNMCRGLGLQPGKPAVPPKPSPELAKFAAQLGTVDDFVNYLSSVETRVGFPQASPGAVIAAAAAFGDNTLPGGKRYLLVDGGVVDFRHFFAAAGERVASTQSSPIIQGSYLSSSEGKTMLYGLANEIGQCIFEESRASCFSREDMTSNRLGAAFGETIVINSSMMRSTPPSDILKAQLNLLNPVPQAKLDKATSQSRLDVVLEVVFAVATGARDLLIPSAY